jgi:hypothetical protein
MRIPRKNDELNDAIELLDQYYIAADKNEQDAWSRLSSDELGWIDTELERILDLRYYLENYHVIKTEHGVLKTLYPFWDHQEILYGVIQEEWEANGYCKIIVLKPRQTGISVWTAASMFHRTITTPHSFTMIVAQNGDTSTHLYNMSLNAYYNLPWWMRPEYLYKTKTGAIEFQRRDEKERTVDQGLGSTIQVSPANQTTGVAIGRTIRNLHASEVSRWPSDEVYEADIKPSMNARDTYAIMESTGFGRQGLFYEQWSAAVDGDTDFRYLFIPVYKVRKYYLPIKGAFDLAEEEQTFNERIAKEEHFAIPDEFWNFRRRGLRAAKRGGNKAGFLESYPLTPAEAFQSSGLCAFDRDSLEYQSLNYIRRPEFIGEIRLISMEGARIDTSQIVAVEDNTEIPRRKSGRGGNRLFIWEMPERGVTYYLGVDVALGNGGDYSVCEVFRAGQGLEPDTQVAEWWGWIPPKKFAHVVAAIGIFYNMAEIAVEYMKDGITTGNELRDIDYPHLYRPQFKDRLTHQASNYLHWLTTSKTRDEIIGTMNEALLDRVSLGGRSVCTVIIRSSDLLDEMIDFAAIDIGGKTEGQGNNDDGVFSAMIGLYCLRETCKHLKSQAVQDDRDREGGASYVYGVYDNFMRQRGQYGVEAEARKMAGTQPGWTVRPIQVSNANTLYSPIFDAMGAEFELYQKHNMHSTEITPEVVWAYRSAMRNYSGTVNGSGDDWL